jgi:hypothetical protein
MDKGKQARIVHKKAIYGLTILGFMDNMDNKIGIYKANKNSNTI